MHVISTKWLTLYSWHPKRGQEAIDAIGVLPPYQGRAMRDRWHSSDHYELLLQMKKTTDAFRE